MRQPGLILFSELAAIVSRISIAADKSREYYTRIKAQAGRRETESSWYCRDAEGARHACGYAMANAGHDTRLKQGLDCGTADYAVPPRADRSDHLSEAPDIGPMVTS